MGSLPMIALVGMLVAPPTSAPPVDDEVAVAAEVEASPTTTTEPEATLHSAPAASDSFGSAPDPLPTEGLIDPWAHVPLQSVVPEPSLPPGVKLQRPELFTAELLDPWASRRRGLAPPVDADLRDPFRNATTKESGALARAELRDPFASLRGPAAPPTTPPAVSPSRSSGSDELRNPFRTRSPDPTPPACPEPAAGQAPAPGSAGDDCPPAAVAPPPTDGPAPRSGSLLTPRDPLAHRAVTFART